ncbi:MAG: hypothetical protein JWM33_909 [Caulobacteraceae bacterium]|nr:hypothetical protein [Caulobacteraceae bacterium]
MTPSPKPQPRPPLSGLVRMHLVKAAESKRPDALLRRFDPPERKP